MALDRDLSIIAQNAGTTAAAILGPVKGDVAEHLAAYDAIRQHVFDGTITLATGGDLGGELPKSVPTTPPPTETEAVREVEKAFGSSVSFKIIEKDSIGQPAPDWLEREIQYQISKGKIAADDTDLWDNRGALPQFGGSGNPNAPWFRTSKGKVGLWPPRPKGGK